jgi:hypothetical protein
MGDLFLWEWIFGCNAMFKKIYAYGVLFFAVVMSAPVQAEAGHGGHDMSKMWADMRSKPVGMAVSVAADESGVLWLAQMKDGRIWVSHSEDDGKRFSDAVAVNAVPESILAEGQNRPQIAVRKGVVVVAWSQALEKTFAGNIRFSRSINSGKTFSTPVTINDVNDEVGHSFAALTMGGGGDIVLAWLDGRSKAEAKKSGKEYIGSSIYYVISQDGGASFSENKKLTDHSCECCRIAITTNHNGVPIVFWRQLFDGGVRDFAFATISAYPSVVRASEDNWQINACPHHGGDIATDEKGSLHLVWFTGSPKNPGLFYRRIDDEHRTLVHPFGNTDAQASYPTVLVSNKTVFIAWREFDGNQYKLMTMQSDDPRAERWSSPRALASASGKTDIPMFVVNTQKPLLVWNSQESGLRVFNLDSAERKP